MAKEFVILDDVYSLMNWNKDSGTIPVLSKKQAEILIDQLAKHDCEIMADEAGRIFFKEADRELIEITLDDVIDQACEWNYRDIRDLKTLCMNAEGFEEFCRFDDKLSELKKTDKILNKLFDETAYGKQITQRMRDLVEKTWGRDNLIPVYDPPMYEDKLIAEESPQVAVVTENTKEYEMKGR